MPLSRWALGQASRDAASWSRPLLVAVKLSAIQFDKDNLLAVVRAALAHSRLAPQRLELQVNEAALRGDAKRTAAILAGLRDEGVSVAFADFGGEHSALAHVRNLPFSKVKVARRLVAQIENAESARSIIRMIIDLAHSKNISAGAEGIETAAQLAFLEQHGCDWLQGYLLGPPLPIDQYSSITENVRAEAAGRSDPRTYFVSRETGPGPTGRLASLRQA